MGAEAGLLRAETGRQAFCGPPFPSAAPLSHVRKLDRARKRLHWTDPGRKFCKSVPGLPAVAGPSQRLSTLTINGLMEPLLTVVDSTVRTEFSTLPHSQSSKK